MHHFPAHDSLFFEVIELMVTLQQAERLEAIRLEAEERVEVVGFVGEARQAIGEGEREDEREEGHWRGVGEEQVENVEARLRGMETVHLKRA
jgi:hypothetical protein